MVCVVVFLRVFLCLHQLTRVQAFCQGDEVHLAIGVTRSQVAYVFATQRLVMSFRIIIHASCRCCGAHVFLTRAMGPSRGAGDRARQGGARGRRGGMLRRRRKNCVHVISCEGSRATRRSGRRRVLRRAFPCLGKVRFPPIGRCS